VGLVYFKSYRQLSRRSAAIILDEKMAQQTPNVQQMNAEKNPSGSNRPASRRQTPLEAAQRTATTTLTRELVKFLGKLATAVLNGFLKKKR